MTTISRFYRTESAALLLIGMVIAMQLFWPPMIGLASNGDFERLMHWGKFEYITNDDSEKYFNWINRNFHITQSPWTAWRGFGSSEVIFVKLSAIIGDWLIRGDGFDLRVIGVVHLLAFVAALWLLMQGWRVAIKLSPLYLLPGILLIFCDVGYTACFNSFYSEPASLIFLLAMVGTGLAITPLEHRRMGLLLFFLSAGLFIAAKPQNFALIPPLLLFCVRLFQLYRKSHQRAITVAFALALMAAPLALNIIAPWYTNNGRYQSTFYGILKDSPDPAADLRELGLDPKFAVLAGTTIFHANLPVDIKGQEFQEQFYRRINHFKIAKFYLTHPRRFLTKLNVTTQNGYQLRLNLGNYEKATGLPARTESHRWSVWSDFKQTYWPKSLWFLAGYCLLLACLILKSYRRSSPAGRTLREFCLMLWLMMLAAFVTPMLGDGESDFIKHLFLFNALFDLSLLLLSGLAMHKLWRVVSAMLQSRTQSRFDH
ncbi:MAG: hypothetical protein M3X11_13195, partial [Acidobacteriota bacterium]|nr:hypothetical protein [Acidobacteriota bacterium]